MGKFGHQTFTRIRLKGGTGSYILAPVLTTTQRNALTAEEGMIIFNSTTDQLEEYDGATWQAVGQVILDTHTADIDAHAYDHLMKFRTGQYMYFPLGYGGIAAGGSEQMAANTLYALAFVVVRALTIDRLMFRVTTGDSGKYCRAGIYNDGTNLYPGTLLKDAGTALVTDTGSKEVTITGNQALTPGVYWLAIISDGVPILRSQYYETSVLGVDNAYNINAGWQVSQTYGALPDPFTAGGTIDTNESYLVMPRLLSLD